MSTENQLQFTPGSVKTAMKGVTSSDLWKVPRDRLHVAEGFNVRIHDAEYKAHIRTLADSMKANGYMQDKPLAGYVAASDDEHDRVIITDGHSRLAAYDLAVSEGMEPFDLPVVTKPRGTSMEDLTIALVTSNSGRQLSPYEIGVVCKRLVGYGMEPKAIAQRLGFTPVYVNGLLDLVAAPKALRDLVTEGKVSATLAVETLKKHGKEAAAVLTSGVKEAKAKGKDRVTKKHVRNATIKAKRAKAEQKELDLEEPASVSQVEQGLINAGELWLSSQSLYATEFECVVYVFSKLTNLSMEEVAPYFEVPSTPVETQATETADAAADGAQQPEGEKEEW